MTHARVLLVTLAILIPLPTALAQDAAPAGRAAEPMRIGIIGASVSAGFGSDYTLAEGLSVAIDQNDEYIDRSSSWFFANHMTSAPKSVKVFRERSVRAVVGLDYLFWFASGRKDLAKRKADVTRAVEFLDGLECPILIGTIPAMRNVGPIVPKDKIIPPDEIPALNAHLAELVSTRKNFSLIPLAAWIAALDAGTPVPGMTRVSERALTRSELFLDDNIHLNRTGLVFAAAMITDVLREAGLVEKAHSSISVEVVSERLAAMTRSFTVALANRPEDGECALRLDIPDLRKKMASGATPEELAALLPFAELVGRRPFPEQGDLVVERIPSRRPELILRLRAESSDGRLSRWRSFKLGKVPKSSLSLRLEERRDVALTVLASPEGRPVSGVRVYSATEREEARAGSGEAPASRPSESVTDGSGVATLGALAPGWHSIVLVTPDGEELKVHGVDPSRGPRTVDLESVRKRSRRAR